MTNNTTAPKRIWRVKPWTPDQSKHGLASWTTPQEAGEGATEYVRADALEAAQVQIRRLRLAVRANNAFLELLCMTEDVDDNIKKVVSDLIDANSIIVRATDDG